MAKESFSRGKLPHWYMPSAMHFVTFRLAGTLPQHVVEDLRQRKARLLGTRASSRELVHKQLFAAYDEYLDQNRQVHGLDEPRIAALVRRSLYFGNRKKYGLGAYCIMPNHVHLLLQPFDVERPSATLEPGEADDAHSPLSAILQGIKSYTAHEANKLLGCKGAFWQHESYDHGVRDEDELERIVGYINANPVKAGLAGRPHDYLWCSAHDRYLYDADESGWIANLAASAP